MGRDNPRDTGEETGIGECGAGTVEWTQDHKERAEFYAEQGETGMGYWEPGNYSAHTNFFS